MNDTAVKVRKPAKKTDKRLYLLALLPFLIIAALYEIMPLISMIASSFRSETDDSVLFTLENYINTFSQKVYIKGITNSLKISLASSAIGIAVAFLGAQAANNSRGKFRSVFMTILNMTSNFAGVPLAFAYMIILGNSGVITQIIKAYNLGLFKDFDLYSSSGLILMYVYFQIPLSTLLLIPAFSGIRKEWQEANMLLGGRGYQFWFQVGIPVLLPSIFGTISVLFANALAAYATAYALLMYNYTLLPVQISSMFTGDMKMQPHMGAALSVVMMLMMCLAILIDNYIVKKTTKWKVR